MPSLVLWLPSGTQYVEGIMMVPMWHLAVLQKELGRACLE